MAKKRGGVNDVEITIEDKMSSPFNPANYKGFSHLHADALIRSVIETDKDKIERRVDAIVRKKNRLAKGSFELIRYKAVMAIREYGVTTRLGNVPREINQEDFLMKMVTINKHIDRKITDEKYLSDVALDELEFKYVSLLWYLSHVVNQKRRKAHEKSKSHSGNATPVILAWWSVVNVDKLYRQIKEKEND